MILGGVLSTICIAGTYFAFGATFMAMGDPSPAAKSLFLGRLAGNLVALVLGLIAGLLDQAAMISAVTLITRRIQDMGYPGWLAVLFPFFPGINLVGVIFLCLVEGTDGPNQYGEPV